MAVAAAWAWRLRERAERPTRSEFIDVLLPSVPESEVRTKMLQARDLGARVSVLSAAAKLGNGSQVSAQDTVPFVLWCAGHHLGRYEEAIRQTLRGGGDLDTTCAMVGGIVVLSGGTESIPLQWRNAREPLPDWPFQKFQLKVSSYCCLVGSGRWAAHKSKGNVRALTCFGRIPQRFCSSKGSAYC